MLPHIPAEFQVTLVGSTSSLELIKNSRGTPRLSLKLQLKKRTSSGYWEYIENGRLLQKPQLVDTTLQQSIYGTLQEGSSVPSLKQCKTHSHDFWVSFAWVWPYLRSARKKSPSKSSLGFWESSRQAVADSTRSRESWSLNQLIHGKLKQLNRFGPTIVKHFNKQVNTNQSQTSFCKQKHDQNLEIRHILKVAWCLMFFSFIQHFVVLNVQYIGGLIFAV